jgi:hypothetical protein
MAFMVCSRGDAIIIFSNYIEGVLDAPVYDVDGVTKFQGESDFSAVLFVGLSPGTLTLVGSVFFQTDTNAGYWQPLEVTVPGATAGQRVWVQVAVSQRLPEFWPPRSAVWYISKVFSLVLRDTPTPLIGLESFNLGPQDFRIERQGDDLVIRWGAFGNATYILESTTDLKSAGNWTEIWNRSDNWAGSPMTVTTAITGQQRFFRLRVLRNR